jgi:NAD(P) transhydrogenase subunit alpha
MKIGILKEKSSGETRVAITPDVAKLFVRDGYEVIIEKNAGLKAGFTDQEYTASGVKISNVPLEVVGDADIILKVQPTPIEDEINEINFAKKGAIIIGFLSLHSNKFLSQTYAAKGISALAVELIPRTTKAQVMDALSSQSNLAGYRAVIEGAYYFKRSFPMFMTSAGTVAPAKVMVLGVGVAGLQAIATAKRLGAIVYGYDIRGSVKDEVESVGGKFLSLQKIENLKSSGDRDKILQEELLIQQNALLEEYIPKMDIVITTAQLLGKPAPKLISKTIIMSMKPGSVVIDMATSSGGNVEGSVKDQIVTINNVNILGDSNIVTNIPYDASRLYSKNLYNIVSYAMRDKRFMFDDELIANMLISHKGKDLGGIL